MQEQPGWQPDQCSGPVLAVLTAAGSGIRLGLGQAKALVPVGGRPMLLRAAESLAAFPGLRAILVTAPADQVQAFSEIFMADGGAGASSEPAALTVGAARVPVLVVAGGSTRQESVAAGLSQLPCLAESVGVTLCPNTCVLVHDAARPLVPVEAVQRVVQAVQAGYRAVVPALPVTDTIKEIELTSAVAPAGLQAGPATPELVTATLRREALRAVQTPQGFYWETLRQAHQVPQVEQSGAVDDASLVELQGGQVHIVEGATLSLKITTATDLALANLLLASS